jgi:hypothetical protein
VQYEIDVDQIALRVVRTDGVAAHPRPLVLRDGGERLVPPHHITVGVRLRKDRHGLTGFRKIQLHLLIGSVPGEVAEVVSAEGDAGHAGRDPRDIGDLDEPDRQRPRHRILHEVRKGNREISRADTPSILSLKCFFRVVRKSGVINEVQMSASLKSHSNRHARRARENVWTR